MLKIITIICLSFSTLLTAETKMLAFAGSTREDSSNKKLVAEAVRIASQLGIQATLIDLKDFPIPFYDADREKKGMPKNAIRLRKLLIESDVIVISSPEYNSSVSAVLKNAIDWASRNEKGGSSRDAFKGKKVILMGASPGKGGAARGLKHLQAIIEDIGGQGTVVSKQITLADSYNAFDSEGKLMDAEKENEIRLLLQEVLTQEPQ